MTCPAVQIEVKVGQVILDLAIDGIDNGNIFPRDKPIWRTTDVTPNKPRCCIYVVGDERPCPDDTRSNATRHFEYPVLVILTEKTARTVLRSSVWMKEARYSLKNMLYWHMLLGPDGVVTRCTYNPSPSFSGIGFVEDLRVSAQMFIYKTVEDRTA
jgi:hypothetical protein